MLRFSLGVTRMDKIRNECIRGTAEVGKFGEKTREARLRWYAHLRRKDDGYIGRRMLRMELPGKRKRGRPKRRFMDVVKEDMAEVEVAEEDTVDRNNWRRKICCVDPWWEKAERRRRRLCRPCIPPRDAAVWSMLWVFANQLVPTIYYCKKILSKARDLKKRRIFRIGLHRQRCQSGTGHGPG